MITKVQKRRSASLFLLMAEINALKKCLIMEYEQSGSLKNSDLIQLSEILDRKLNQLKSSQK